MAVRGRAKKAPAPGPVSRAVKLLQFFAAQGTSTISQVAAALKLPPSTVHRLLDSLAREGLIEGATLRRQEHAVRVDAARRVFVERVHARREDVDAHDHSASAAVRCVVDALVLAEAEVAQRAHTDLQLSAASPTADEARLEKRLEELGKQRDDVDSQGYRLQAAGFRE